MFKPIMRIQPPADHADALARVRSRMIHEQPFWGLLASDVAIFPSDKVQRVASTFSSDGQPFIVYNPQYFEQLSGEELLGTLLHAMRHLVMLHPVRISGYDPKSFGQAADALVDDDPIIQKFLPEQLRTDLRDLVDDPQKPRSVEELSIELSKQQQNQGDQGSEDSEGGDSSDSQMGMGSSDESENSDPSGEQESQEQEESAESGEGQSDGDSNEESESDAGDQESSASSSQSGADDHELWGETTQPEFARAVMEQMVESAANKTPGKLPAEVGEMLNALRPPELPWPVLLRHFALQSANTAGLRSYRRPSRRGTDPFVLPGHPHLAGRILAVLVDTSGSVGTADIERFFGEIERLSLHDQIWVITFDAEASEPREYRLGEWKRIPLSRGGTDVRRAFKMVGKLYPTPGGIVVFTDGYTPYPAKGEIPIPTLWVMTTSERAPFGIHARFE